MNQKKTTRKHDEDAVYIHATDIFKECPRVLFYRYLYGDKEQNEIKKPELLLTFEIGRRLEEMLRDLLEGKDAEPICITIKNSKRQINLIGSPDIIYKDKYIVECKTINRMEFSALKQPLQNHVAQISFYLWISEKLQLPYEKKGFIIYIPKEQHEELVKIFEVELSSHYRKIYDDYLENLKLCVKKGILPPRTCLHINHPITKRCPYADICFDGGHETW